MFPLQAVHGNSLLPWPHKGPSLRQSSCPTRVVQLFPEVGWPWVAQIQQLSVGLSRMDGHGPNPSQQELAWCWALIKLDMIPYAMPLTATVGLPRITKDYQSSFMLTTKVVRLVAAVVLWGCLPACFELPFMRQPWLCHGIGERDEID